MDLEKLRAQLTKHEGVRLRFYIDTEGNVTIGRGHNLSAKGISITVAELMYQEDVAEVITALDRRFPWWQQEDEVRQRVMADLAFNMGTGKLAFFIRMLDAWQRHDYAEAARELLASRWAQQVKGTRAGKLALMLKTGEDEG